MSNTYAIDVHIKGAATLNEVATIWEDLRDLEALKCYGIRITMYGFALTPFKYCGEEVHRHALPTAWIVDELLRSKYNDVYLFATLWQFGEDGSIKKFYIE